MDDAMESFKCPRCGHAGYDHIDIASYRMAQPSPGDWRWCSGGDGNCGCGLAFDDMRERCKEQQ